MEKGEILNVVFHEEPSTGDIVDSYIFRKGENPIHGSVDDGVDACKELRKQRPNDAAIEAFFDEKDAGINMRYIYLLNSEEFNKHYESFKTSTEKRQRRLNWCRRRNSNTTWKR